MSWNCGRSIGDLTSLCALCDYINSFRPAVKLIHCSEYVGSVNLQEEPLASMGRRVLKVVCSPGAFSQLLLIRDGVFVMDCISRGRIAAVTLKKYPESSRSSAVIVFSHFSQSLGNFRGDIADLAAILKRRSHRSLPTALFGDWNVNFYRHVVGSSCSDLHAAKKRIFNIFVRDFRLQIHFPSTCNLPGRCFEGYFYKDAKHLRASLSSRLWDAYEKRSITH